MLIDSHCHVRKEDYENADEIIRRSLDSGVWLVAIAADRESSKDNVKITGRYPEGVFATIGLHPDIVGREDFAYDDYLKLAKSSDKVVAIGEVGLDYLANPSQIEKQKEIFQSFLDMSRETGLPVVLHCRGTKENSAGAYDDMLAILSEEKNHGIKGVIHCFGGNLEQAERFISLGFYIGITGIITFKKKAETLQAIVRSLPLEKMVIETDAPYLAPEPHRGEKNEPAFVRFVAEKIAELKNIDFETVAEATVKNTKKLYRLICDNSHRCL